MNRNIIKGICLGRLLRWVVIPICLVVLAVISVPDIAKPENVRAGGATEMVIPQQGLKSFVEATPGDIELTGMVIKIGVNVEGGVYECYTLFNIARMGNGLSIDHMLYTTDPAIQSLFETASISDKAVRVFVKELPNHMEFEGKTYDIFEVHRAVI